MLKNANCEASFKKKKLKKKKKNTPGPTVEIRSYPILPGLKS